VPDPPASQSFELQALLDAAVDAIILIDHNGVIEVFNQAAARLFGYAQAEALGRNVKMLMTGQHLAQHDAYLERYLRTGAAHIIGTGREVPARRKDGSIFPAFLSVGRIEGSNPARFVGFIHDITESRRAEKEAVEARERMMHVSRLATMGEMASGISHELNQPLTAIANYAQACVRLLAVPNPDLSDVRDALEQIAGQALRAGEIIRRLRSLVRKRETQREHSDVNELIRELNLLARADARSNDVRIILELAADLPPVSLDRIQMQQVMLNLVRNSIDALEAIPAADREIIIRSGASTTGDVFVEIADHGVGIAPEMLPHLFTPFATNKPEGTGLGLAISRTIVEAHRGRLDYCANRPRGAVFTVTLPGDAGVPG
jgi:two-component system sensor kinase FixL